MRYGKVGDTGLEVSRLGLGTMGFGLSGDDYDPEQQVRAFVEAGGTLVDTAPLYGDGRAEQLLGDVVTKLGIREQLVLASTGGLDVSHDQARTNASRSVLLRQLDDSLRALRTDYLDLWQLHGWDHGTPLEETLSAWEYALASGRVRYLGICNCSAWQMALIHNELRARPGRERLASIQTQYSLLDRVAESEIVPAAQHLGVGLLAWAPLAGGVLTGKYQYGVPADSRAADPNWAPFIEPLLGAAPRSIVDSLVRAGEGLQIEPAQVALAWLAERPGIASVIVGARSQDQLKVSLASSDSDLPAEISQALDDVSAELDWPER